MTVLTKQQYVEQRVQLAVEVADMDCRRLGWHRNQLLKQVAGRERKRAAADWAQQANASLVLDAIAMAAE